MKTIQRVRALLIASALTLLFGPTSAEAQKALVYCPAVDQSGCTTVRSALTGAFPGGVDIGDDGANGTIDLRTADLFQYAVFFVPSLAETDSAAPYARLREQVVADRLKLALLGRRAFWSGTPDQGVLATTRPQKDELIRNLAAWASADFGTVNAPGLVVLQDNSDVVTQRYSWVQPIVGFQIVADPKLASYSSVRSLTAAGNAILSSNGTTLAYANMASFGFQTPSGASGVSLDAVGQTGTSVGGQIVLLTQMGANTGGAVIRTDTDDYPPGTPVIMTGSGFQAGETVTLTLHEDPLLHPDRVHTATADANGGFVYSGFSPEDHDIDVRFILTAKGQASGRQAQTTFTDGQPQSITVTNPSSVSVSAGNSAQYVVNVTMGGNSNTCTITMEVTSALPAGVTASFDNNPVVLPNGSGSTNFSRTLTLTTTAATPVGSYPLTVRATRAAGSNCQTGGSDPTVGVTLVVTAVVKQDQATVNVTNMPASPQQFGASFTVGANGGSGSGAYNFSATGACTVGFTTGVVNITSSAGICSITAIRLGDASFNDSAPSAPATVNATVATQPAVTLTVPSTTAYPTGYTASASGGVAGASFTYSTSSLACSVNQSTGLVTILSTGTCAITATAKSANYADATDTRSTTITPGTQPAVTLTLPATTTYPTGVTASAAGGAAGASFSYSTLSSACAVNASSGVVTINSVGSCAITATATAANYADATDTKTLTIGAAATTTVVTVANATFDGAPHGGTALVTGPGGLSQSLTVSYVGRNGTTYPLSTTAPTNAGDYTASASYAAAGNYLGSSDSQDFSIGKATATITVNGFTGPYDGVAHGATGTATGVGGVTLSGLNLGASFTDVPGGTATWTFTDVTGNYGNATGSANIVISKANQSITFGTLANKTYGDAPFAVSATASSGLSVDFSVSGNCSIAGSTVTITGAGSCTVTAKQAGNGNYSAATDVSQSFDIAKAKATVTVNGYSGVYDAAAHGATGSATGIGGMDLSSLLNLGDSFTNVPGGTASWSFAGNANYEAASGTAAIVISKANATITVDGYTGTYDGNAHGATGSAKGIGGANLSGLNLGASFTNVPGGTATWTFTDATGNYNDATGTVAIVINKANATVNVSGYTGVYDGAAHGATGTATGVKGESLTGLDLGASFTNVPGGTASWTFTDVTGNYNNVSGSAAITISKADATIAVNGYTGVYDGDAHGATGAATGVGGSVLSGLSLGASFTNVPGGTANWTFTDATGNYKDASGSVAITITKANATVNVSGYTGVYDGAAHGATGTATGVKGEPLAGLNLGASFTNVPGGPASWTFTDATGNYNNTSGTAAITISKANATITVDGYTGTYDGDAHGATGSAKGVLGETLSGLDFGASFTNVPGGTANWTFIDVTGNYNNNSGTAAIVISKASASITVNGYTGVYDAAAHGATGTATGVGGVALAGLNLGASFTNVPGGTATWTFTDATGNYNDATGTAAIVISQATPVVTAVGGSFTFDGVAHPGSGTATGVSAVDLGAVTLSYTKDGASFAGPPINAGSYEVTAHYAGSTNYTAGSSSPAAIEIAKANATITVDGYTGIYDGDPHGAAGSAKGIGGVSLSGLNLGASFTNVPGGTASWTFTDVTGNYNNANGSAPIVITKANPTITANGYNGVYDGNPHGATGNAKGVKDEALTGLNLGASFTDVPGGTANWTYTDATGNYNNANGTAAILITQATPVVTATGGTFVFNGSPKAGAGSATGVGSATLTPVTLSYVGTSPTVYGPSAQAPTNAGTYTVTATYGGSTNYTPGSSAPATLTINKATIAGPILTDLVKGYNGNALKPTVTITPTGVQVTLEFKQDGAPKGSPDGVIPVGVYNVLAKITDPNYTGPSSDALFVIYDPTAGFVTGGGWIDSPPNSYTADMSLTGKANFGFVSKYQKGTTVPTGNTEFQFKEGNLNFKSTNFQWLVIQGTSQAQFKGTGTINGAGNYNFMVTVVDGDAMSGTKKPDTFRIKITQGTDTVYDNKMGTTETSFDGTVIGGGSIQIQTK